MLSEHETNTKAALHYFSTTILKLFSSEIHRSAIMQDFRDSEKKIIINNNKNGSHFDFFSVKFVMGYPCVRHYMLFYKIILFW